MGTHATVNRNRTGGIAEEKMIVGSARPFIRQDIRDMVKSARKRAESWKCEEGEKTYLHRS